MTTLHFLVSLFFLFSCFLPLVFSFHPPPNDLPEQCLDDQRSLLLQLQLQHDFYYGPNFTFSSKFELWDANTDCCWWEGVTCDALGHVIGQLSLIFNLHHLQHLNLAGNNFNTTLLSYGFDKLPNLTHLNLSSSCFHGHVPHGISLLTRLVSLDLSYQGFIKTLDKLVVLDLSNNHIHGVVPNWLWKTTLSYVDLSFNPIDFPKQLPLSDANFSFPKLAFLYLGSCNISAFPEFLRSLDHLENLDLSNNRISDEIPNWATQLRSLKIGGNELKGKLSRSLATCSKLEVLDIRNNMVHDTFPFWLANLLSLKVLILRGNRFYGALSVEFLQSLKAMAMINDDDKANLKYVGEDYYQDSVTIVNKGVELFYEKVLTTHTLIDNLKDLESLDLSLNKLSGKIPPQLTSLTFLEALDLSYNQLEGSIPQSYQFNKFSNDSYRGNPNLCGPPLSRKCNEDDLPTPHPAGEDEEDSWLDTMST
ncbi:hypothetical protein V6N11_065526 [Hibiscus sabdariffa]|uniref:Leucine-rich repeat-containing N-terminal plant-type domain-containing protein n=1 Tax=Hibiscus sabdariffa TaxID=183260 RepID=A0ABR2PHL0_9ROSI